MAVVGGTPVMFELKKTKTQTGIHTGRVGFGQCLRQLPCGKLT